MTDGLSPEDRERAEELMQLVTSNGWEIDTAHLFARDSGVAVDLTVKDHD